MFRLDRSSYTATDTHLFSDQVHVFIYLVFYLFSCTWWCEIFVLGVVSLCRVELVISRSWFVGGISRV